MDEDAAVWLNKKMMIMGIKKNNRKRRGRRQFYCMWQKIVLFFIIILGSVHELVLREQMLKMKGRIINFIIQGILLMFDSICMLKEPSASSNFRCQQGVFAEAI